jgi:hypothetical protein
MKGIGRKTGSGRQKWIQGLLGFHRWAFCIEIWATEDTLLFLVYERLDSESPNTPNLLFFVRGFQACEPLWGI